jgi:hypothetical protein
MQVSFDYVIVKIISASMQYYLIILQISFVGG